MAQKTKTIPNWLLWGIWITAGLCIAAIVLLAVLTAGRISEPAEQPTEAAVKTAEQSTQPEEPVPEEETGEKIPVFDLLENPYAGEDFAFRGRYLECISGPCRIGIDVSAWQNEINWPLVKAAGMEFAMIRLAYRGSTAGNLREDDFAAVNYRGAKDAGLEVGCYVYSQAITPEEAVEEAELALQMVQDWKLELPIVFDWEQSGDRTAGLSKRTLTDCAAAFCQTIEDAGYDAMIYFNKYQAYNKLELDELKEYGFWFAMYSETMDFPYRVDMWQYSESGTVPGIDGLVDLNILFEYQ